MQSDAPTRVSAAIAVGWGAAGAAACAAVAGLEPNMVEEGLVLHVAQRLVAGEHLYRDIVFFTGPLVFELLAALFRLFGEEIFVARAAAALLHGVTTGVVYAFARRAGVGALAHAAASVVAAAPLLLFPLFAIYYYTPFAFCLSTLAAYCALRGIGSSRWAFAAGVLVSAVALCKQTLGVMLALGLLVALLGCAPAGRRVVATRALALGGLISATLTIGFYVWIGDLDEMVRWLVMVPLSLEESFRSPFMNLWPPGRFAPEITANRVLYLPNLYILHYGVFSITSAWMTFATQVLYALPFLTLGATLLLRLRGPLPAAVWLNAAVVLTLGSNLFPRADWGHLVFALPSSGVQLVLLLGVALHSRKARRVAASIPVAATALAGVAIAVWLNGLATRPTWGARVPLRPVSDSYRAPQIPRVIHYVREHVEPGEPIFVARAEPLLYFATGTTNLTPFGGVLTVLHEEQERAILAALPKVRFVIMSDMDQPIYTYYSDELPRVQEYLERHFHIAPFFPHDPFGWIHVLDRRADRGPTATDLNEIRSTARAWTVDARRRVVPNDEPPPKVGTQRNRRPLMMRLGPWGGGIEFDIDVPEGAVFQTDTGLRGLASLEEIYSHPRDSWMVVSIGEDGEFAELARQRIPQAGPRVHRWSPLEADLAAYAGRRVTLRLELIPESVLHPDFAVAWWGSPRIALRPEGG